MKALFAPTKHCPRCGTRTQKKSTPLLARPFAWLLRGHRFRRCMACGWVGLAPRHVATESRGGAAQSAIKAPPLDMEGFELDFTEADREERAMRDLRRKLEG